MEKKKDLRVIKTQLALQNSFIELLKEKTFDEVTVGEICDRAMVRRATFYNHYADKYAFLTDFIREKSYSFQEEITKQHTAETLEDYSSQMFEKFIDFIEELHLPPSIVEGHLFSTLSILLTDEIQLNISEAIERFEEKNGALPAHRLIISNFFAGGIIQLAKSWFLSPGKMDKNDLFREFHTMMEMFLKQA